MSEYDTLIAELHVLANTSVAPRYRGVAARAAARIIELGAALADADARAMREGDTSNISFDEMTEIFTRRVAKAAGWKHNYPGAAYSTRIKAAISDLRLAIDEAESNPEIKARSTP